VDAGACQAGALRAPKEERRSDPILKRANTPAKSRLRHVPRVGRPREAFQFRQRREVLEPVEIHVDAVYASGEPIMALANKPCPAVPIRAAPQRGAL
jgi:hypothetical protein